VSDLQENQVLINYGITNFGNIFSAMTTMFIITLGEDWPGVMYNMLDATMSWLAIFVCVSVVILCGFFLLNVILAVLANLVVS